MSAFICSKLHIQTIAQAYVNMADHSANVIDVANVLYKENTISVNYRYNETTRISKWKILDKKIKPVTLTQLYKLIQCLDYQSCEHPGWKDSHACKMLELLEATIVPSILNRIDETDASKISNTVAYNNAEWCI